ncbi:MAG: hypothetical protein ACOYBY_15225 [Dermatophilaceae bacterium]
MPGSFFAAACLSVEASNPPALATASFRRETGALLERVDDGQVGRVEEVADVAGRQCAAVGEADSGYLGVMVRPDASVATKILVVWRAAGRSYTAIASAKASMSRFHLSCTGRHDGQCGGSQPLNTFAVTFADRMPAAENQ